MTNAVAERRSDVSSRIVLALRDYAHNHIGADVANEVFETACRDTETEIDDAADPTGWVSLEMFYALAHGLTPLVRGDFITDAVTWVVPARRELSSMSLTAIARPVFFYRQLDRARGFFAKHVSFDVDVTSAHSARAELRYRDDIERRSESCAIARGVLQAIPLLFHLPAADVTELECYADGADCCRYEIHWQRSPNHGLIGLGIGAAAGIVGALVLPSLLWLALPTAGWLLGALLGGLRHRAHMTRVIEEQRVALGNAETDLERRFGEVRQLKDALIALEQTQSEILDAGLQALLGDVVGDLAHEMRNPMSYVLHNLSALEEVAQSAEKGDTEPPLDVEAEELEEVLGDIRYGVERMRHVLGWFVDVFRSGTQDKTLVYLDKEIEKAAEVLRRDRSARVQVHLELAPVAPVESFGKEVVQVLVNLLVNATHATTNGNIWISTETRGANVVFQVRDDGTGMAPDVLERAFERGFSTKSRSRSGGGLGLFICRGIAERNGGTIELESKLGEGTTATVTLPAATT